jgi:hypothetical protein
VDAKPEGLHIDFKEAAFEGDDVRSSDRKNLVKGVSGFGNFNGGLLVYGAKTRNGPGKEELLDALPGVTPLDQYAERIRVHARSATTPPMSGLDVRSFANSSQPNTGVVVVYVPWTDSGPYRAEGPDPDVSGRYYVRTTTDMIVMPHQYLAAMFGRRPHPRLRLGLQRKDTRNAYIHVENVGHGAAMTPFVRLKFEFEGQSIVTRGAWLDRRNDVVGPAGWKIGFSLPPGELIYPQESRIVAAFDFPGDDREVTVRVDCENAQPLECTKRVTFARDIVWFDAPIE